MSVGMSYESAMARVDQLRQMTDTQPVAPARTAGPDARGGSAAFALQLQAAMQQQAGGDVDGDPAGGGLPMPAGGYGAAGGYGPAGAGQYGVPGGYGAGGAYGAAPGPYGGAPGPYGAAPPPYGVAAAPYYGQPYQLLGPGYGAPPVAGVAQLPFLTGDVQGLSPDLAARLNEVGRRLGTQVRIESGLRTRAEQERLYQAFLNGTGNLAAVPGTSRHESGRAADVYVGGVALGSHAQGRRIAGELGLGWPVGGEPWHTELVR